MKKLLGCAAISLGLLLPAASASAAVAPPAGTDPCPGGQNGVVVWHWDTTTNQYRYHHVCFNA